MTTDRAALEAQIADLQAKLAALDKQEPDPLLIEARKIAYETRRKRPGCAGYADAVCQKIKVGEWDDHMLVLCALAALRRGMELAAPSPVAEMGEAEIEALGLVLAKASDQLDGKGRNWAETAFKATDMARDYWTGLARLADAIRRVPARPWPGDGHIITLRTHRDMGTFARYPNVEAAIDAILRERMDAESGAKVEPEFIHTSGYAEMLEPQEPEWIDWHGGECPVPAGTRVEVRFKAGHKDIDTEPETLDWEATSVVYSIVAYRILADAKSGK
jgi:hypothetical protein